MSLKETGWTSGIPKHPDDVIVDRVDVLNILPGGADRIGDELPPPGIGLDLDGSGNIKVYSSKYLLNQYIPLVNTVMRKMNLVSNNQEPTFMERAHFIVQHEDMLDKVVEKLKQPKEENISFF